MPELFQNIRVNAIAPGFFLTQQNHFLLIDEKTGNPTPRGKTIIDHTPMGRYGEAEELVGTTVWLLSDAARFVTGIVVPVDGGFSALQRRMTTTAIKHVTCATGCNDDSN